MTCSRTINVRSNALQKWQAIPGHENDTARDLAALVRHSRIIYDSSPMPFGIRRNKDRIYAVIDDVVLVLLPALGAVDKSLVLVTVITAPDELPVVDWTPVKSSHPSGLNKKQRKRLSRHVKVAEVQTHGWME